MTIKRDTRIRRAYLDATSNLHDVARAYADPVIVANEVEETVDVIRRLDAALTEREAQLKECVLGLREAVEAMTLARDLHLQERAHFLKVVEIAQELAVRCGSNKQFAGVTQAFTGRL